MSRISISVSEELMARLEPVKERINVSHVCREALERRIGSLERASEQGSEELDLEGLIDRLREERTVAEGRFEQLGRRNAATWLATASYAELKRVAENHVTVSMEKYKLPRSCFRQMKQDMEAAKVGSDGLHSVAYKTSWLDYVRAIWAQLLERVEDTNGARAAEAVDTTK